MSHKDSLSTAYPIYSWVTGSLCLSPASLGIKAGYTLDGVPTHRRAHTHSHTTDNLEMPINLQRMSLDWGKKPEYLEETPEARGEHANSTHPGGGGNQTPNPGCVRRTFCRNCFQTAVRSQGPQCPLCRSPVSERQQRATDVQQRMREKKGKSVVVVVVVAVVVAVVVLKTVVVVVIVVVVLVVVLAVVVVVVVVVVVNIVVVVKFFSKMRLHYRTCRKYIEEFGPISEPTLSLPVQTPNLPESSVFIPNISFPTASNSAGRLYTCPYCSLADLSDMALVEHCVRQHHQDRTPIVCPICVRMPWGITNYTSRNFIGHLVRRHRFSYSGYMNESEEEEMQLLTVLQMSVQEF
ncbi:hypothetical protein QTP86_031105 [Hemibagrus guttatus]|nr:hypothetical protein QTP86_031105 [Hemibagrus guttatus]